MHYASGVNALDLRNASAVIDLFERAADVMSADPGRTGCAVRVPARGRLLATGDLHDNTEHLKKIVQFAKLDDSPDNHLVLHELIHGDQLVNGMDFSHRILARVAELVLNYPTQAHPLLANHEIAQLTGSGVSKGAGNSVELFNQGLEYVFGEECDVVLEAIRTFFRAMPIGLLSGGLTGDDGESAPGVCVTHSLPNVNMMKHFDLDLFERGLVEVDFHGPFGRAYILTWGRMYTEELAEELAARWNVKLFVVGHQHVADGADVLGKRILILNSDHQRGKVLPIDLANPPDAHEALMQTIPLAAFGAD